ncbi:MAG: DUF6106 family protein [Butyrivibrio sp.]|nr:DUF6106 family protein [Butyrivibrio sp.]
MNDNNYVECLVSRKPSVLMKFLKILTIMLAVAFFFLGMMSIAFFIIFIAMCVAAYFVFQNASIEYEYLYCDREISIDRIYNKSRRKNAGKFETDKMEILAPARSYHLDEYKNKQSYKVLDYSSGIKDQQPDPTYVMYYDGREKIVFEPNAEFVAAVKNVAPRKVFTD